MALLSTERNIGPVHDRAQIVHTLARAFQDDPALSWILPDAAQRKIRLPRMFDFIVPLDLRDGFALGSADGEAATLWRSPGKPHTGMLDMVMMLPAVFHTFGTAALRGLAVSEAMDAHHPKGITYFYLHYAGVLPEHQGKGWGGAAIRAGLDKADAAGIPVFATGGIGGVHRGGEVTLDVSADLAELGRTPVAVVCAGVKSLLDSGRTLEVLETQGVAVRLRLSFSPSSTIDGPAARAGRRARLRRFPGLLHAIQRRARAVAPGDAGRSCGQSEETNHW
jgi:GNAT superfamily N-acetyltransferase